MNFKVNTTFWRGFPIAPIALLIVLCYVFNLRGQAPAETLRFGPEILRSSSGDIKPVRDVAHEDAERQELSGILAKYRDLSKVEKDGRAVLVEQQMDELEKFVARRPDGAHTPSVRVNLGYRYRDSGKFSRALAHWRKAADACRTLPGDSAHNVTDHAITQTAALLASLGRLEELENLLREHQNRQFSEHHLAQKWVRTREAAAHMKRKPGLSYKCGVYALNNAAQALTGVSHAGVWEKLSKVTGFSLSELATVSDEFQLGLVPAFRGSDAEIIVPSVVHWKENHYAAVLEERAGNYRIKDPTFRWDVWIARDALIEEASGYFMVPRAKLVDGWRIVLEPEAGEVFGKGYPEFMEDSNPEPCVECCEPGDGGEGTGSGTNECGMATWRVMEPNINLIVSDVPMMYKAAYGPDFVLKLQYRQRLEAAVPQNHSHFESGWHSDLLSYVYGSGDQFYLVWGDGSTSEMIFDGASSTTNYSTGRWATRTQSGSDTTQITVFFKNGSSDVYELVAGSYSDLVLRERRDATGKGLTFAYEDPDGVDYLLQDRLVSVTTADGKTFEFHYDDSSHLYRITKVTGPDNREVTFTYAYVYPKDLLESVTDVVGLVSTFGYSGQGQWLTSLTTPYGTTSFTHYDLGSPHANPQGNLEHPGIDRYIVIDEPGGAQQVYAFYDNPHYDGAPDEMAGKIPTSFSSGQLPDTQVLPLPSLDTSRNRRNSHYWGRQQTAALSATNPIDPHSFTNTDFGLSRTRHWLMEKQTPGRLRTLGWELPPSVDGMTESQPLFYNYGGKAGSPWGPEWEGTNSMPNLLARKMPDGTTWYESTERNGRGMRTRVTERWVENSQTLYRTNTFLYKTGTGNHTIDDLLLIEHKGPGGQLIVGYSLHSTYPDQYATATNGVLEVTTFDYNAERQITSKTTHAGLTTTYSYDSTTKRLTNVVDSASGIDPLTNSYTWLDGFVRTHTDPRGLTRTFDYDLLGRLESITYPDSSTEEVGYSLPNNKGFNTSGSAVPLLDPVSYKDRLNNTWFVYPNRLRQVATFVEPSRTNGVAGVETWFDYCGCGSVTTQIRGANTSTRETNIFEFNYQGRLKRAVFPDSSEINFTFDPLGRPLTRNDGSQQVTTNVYDNLSRLVLQRNAAGLVQWRNYDPLNRVLQLTNSSGVLITNQFDGIGRLTKQVFPGGVMNQWAYTAGFADATSFTDGENDTTHWQFDPLQRLRKEWVSTVYTNEFIYSGPNLSELKDGKQQSTKWGYDLYGNVTNKIDAANTVIITNQWNANGQMIKRWTREKTNLTHFAYDAVGNMTNVDYSTGSDLQFVYNAFSRLAKDVRTGTITNVYTYKPGGALESEETPQWASSKVTLGYTHRLRTSLALQQPGSSDWTHSYVYDNARRLDYISGSSGTFDYSYKSVANQTASRLVNGITIPTASAGAHITNFFDSLGRMTSTLLRNGTTIFNVHSNALNAAHQPTKQTRFDNSFIDYAYDDAGQLISAKAKEANGSTVRSHEQFGYKYDGAGNLNVRTNNALEQTFTPDNRNQLSSVARTGNYTVAGGTVGNASSVHVITNGSGWLSADLYTDKTFAKTGVPLLNGNNTFTAVAQDSAGRTATNTVSAYFPANASFGYDQNGNLTNDTHLTYVYDTENQLVQVLKPNASKSDFIYDARLRRRVRTEASWTGSAWLTNEIVNYVYDGNLVLQERHLHPDTQQLVRLVTYTRGNDLSGTRQGAGGIRGMLARTETVVNGPTMVAFYHGDHVGNITAMLNVNQVVVARYLYDPFGRTIAISGPWAGRNLYRFSSKEYHEPSGLSYYGYRFYSPELQRWVNRDPIQERGGANLYSFVGNNPRAGVDPSGLFCTPETAFDVASMALGAASFGENLGLGNYGAAALDLFGYGVDSLAAVTPMIPGGMGAWLKGLRAAAKTQDASNLGRRTGGGGAVPWTPGMSPQTPTRNGPPSDSTVRRREWKNEADNPTRSDYTQDDFERMRRGEPPLRFNPDKGGMESMERSHEPIPKREGGTDTVPRWPQEHAKVDPCRRPGY